MTTRQFDPVLSAALRNELEALADAPEETTAPERHRVPALRRPQVWISVVTALVLVAATIGVLQVTHGGESAPAGKSSVVDPLAQITHPSDANYVARLVRTLLAARGSGSATHAFEVPSGVRSVRTYIDCAPSRKYATGIDRQGESSGECDRTLTGFFDMPIAAGRHTLTVTVSKGTEYSVLVMASPAPTVSSGALIDPLAQVRDLRNPDALTGDTAAVLESTQGAGDSGGTASTPLHSSARLRAYFVCETTSSTAQATVDGHVITGCMNSIAHWFDFTPGSRTLTATVGPDGPSALLIVRAPNGAKDSPANTTLAYPEAPGPVLAEARGAGAAVSGTYRKPGTAIAFTITCRGSGWLEIETGDGGTNTRQTPCSVLKPDTVGFGGDGTAARQKWAVVPHGDISWTFQLTSDD